MCVCVCALVCTCTCACVCALHSNCSYPSPTPYFKIICIYDPFHPRNRLHGLRSRGALVTFPDALIQQLEKSKLRQRGLSWVCLVVWRDRFFTVWKAGLQAGKSCWLRQKADWRHSVWTQEIEWTDVGLVYKASKPTLSDLFPSVTPCFLRVPHLSQTGWNNVFTRSSLYEILHTQTTVVGTQNR